MMKLSKVFTVVLSLHVLAIFLLVIQPGCHTMNQEPGHEATRMSMGSRSTDTPSEDELSPVNHYEEDSLYASESPRYEPMRPKWDDEFDEEVEDVVTPLPMSPNETPVATYKVKKGDSLWVISRRFNTTLDRLLALNNLNRKSVLRVGQTIKVPSTEEMREACREEESMNDVLQNAEDYKVSRGDTLSGIAKRFDTTVSALKQMNGLSSYTIRIGQVLKVPSPNVNSLAGAKSSHSSSSDPRADSASEVIEHVVESGETPGKIAQIYGMKTVDLLEMNNIKDPRRMRSGQVLKVRPGKQFLYGSNAARGSAKPSTNSQAVASERVTTVKVVESKESDLLIDEMDDWDDSLFDDVDEIPVIPVETSTGWNS